MEMLVREGSHHYSERVRTNTPEDPYHLRGYYDIPIDWEDFWRCFNDAIASYPSNAEATERYGDFKVSPSDIIKKAVDAYHQTDRFVKALTAVKEAIKAKEIADKAEEVRVRQDVPEVTKMYDALLLEKKDLEKQLNAYKGWSNKLCANIQDIERKVYEAKWAPKYFKDDMERIKRHTVGSWNGKSLVVENSYYGGF